MRNKNLTAAAAVATAAALMLAGCATQKPAASSSEAASTAPAESSVVEETTPEEAPSEVTDVDEAAAEDLLLSTETMHYSADDEDGVVTVHKYDENGNEVFIELFLFQLHTGFIHSEECHFPQHTGQAKLKAVDVDTRWCKFPAKNFVPSAEFKSVFRGKVLIHHRVFDFVRAHKGQHLVTNRLRYLRVLFFPVTEVSHFDTDSVIAFIAKSLANHNDTLLIRVYCFWRDGLHSGKCSIDFLNCCRLFLVIGIHGSKFFRQLVFIAMHKCFISVLEISLYHIIFLSPFSVL